MSRSTSQTASLPSKSFSKSLPSSSTTPFFLTPQPSSLNVSGPRRLLMPTVRHPRPTHTTALSSPKGSSQKSPQSSRLSRSRASSVSPSVPTSPDPSSLPVNDDWIGGGCTFEVVQDNIELEGYQLYAVEKWCVVVERRRQVTVLAVFTGDRRHRITVTALSPSSCLPQVEATAMWEKAMHQLRRDGARPKDTEQGVIMVTSLANFRSDFTIVHIPKGNFLDVREQLYTNINLLRMGCSGRSALTLEEPSDATKDRFISQYHLSDKLLARSQPVFNPTVIELVKLIQASLAICGMFPLAPDERNGLLCDLTVDGIQRWVTEIGEPVLKMEPVERVVDPAVVAALFSTILTVRNKLQALGHPVPKDPFIDPAGFLKSLHSFQSSLKPGSHSHTLSLSHHSSHSTPVPPSASIISSSTIAASNASTSTANVNMPMGGGTEGTVYLTHKLINAIQAAYDKLKQSESYKVHRVLINKLDDLATDLRTSENKSKSGGRWGQGSVFNNNQPVADLAVLVRCIGGGGVGPGDRGGPSSLRYLWTGRPEEVGRKRREKEIAEEGDLVEAEGRTDKEKERGDREKEREGRERMSVERDVKSSEDEGDIGYLNKPWSGRMQRRIEVWAALGRAKKLSADFGSKGRATISPESPPRATHGATQLLPSVVISRDPADEEEVLSSGQASPVSDSHQHNPMMLGLGVYPPAQRSASELSEYDRRVTEFDARRPPTKAQYQTRIISWSDPVTARGLLDEDGDSLASGNRRSKLGASPLSRDYVGDDEVHSGTGTGTLVDDEEGWNNTHVHVYQRQRTIMLKKRRSFDDADRLRGSIRVLPIERMRIDVELCGQLLILRRREAHLANVIACLRALTQTLSNTNAHLRSDYEEKQAALKSVEECKAVLQGIEAMRVKADATSQETQALAYESAQFLVEDLWHMANQPRQKVLELREKVFGTGTKRSRGGKGRERRFCRVQTMLDGTEVLVDEMGRTEEEAEEEERLGLSGSSVGGAEDVEAEGMEHPGLRPTWVLRLFNYWGTRWGARGRGAGS
ncbi:hypothetical protein BXZ70DRAFT_966334, partial [Cristinia sonorae]